MQKLPGSLTVEHITGRWGKFSSGILETSIGKFKVSDSTLDQFAPGTYQGEFWVNRIYYKTSPWRSGLFIQLMAEIARDGYVIQEADEADGLPTPAQAEPDLAETVAPGQIEALEAVVVQADAVTADASISAEAAKPMPHTPVGEASGSSDDLTLFGMELGPLVCALHSPIALDNTIEDRVQFRLQRDRLKALGYRFLVGEQQWYLNPVKAALPTSASQEG